VGDIEVAHHQGMVTVLGQLRKAGAHHIKEPELVILLGGAHLAGVDVGTGNSELDRVAGGIGKPEIGLHPAACSGEVVIPDAVPGFQRFLA
jgi:hypothetical protein